MKKKEILAKVKIGMTRDEVVEPPKYTGGSTRKYPTPSIYVYGKDIELHFQGWKTGGLGLVFDNKTHTTLLK